MEELLDSLAYWLPGENVSKHIIVDHVDYFLGPNAKVEPYAHQVCSLTTFPSAAKDRCRVEKASLSRERCWVR